MSRDSSREESPKNITPSRSGCNIPLKVPEEGMSSLYRLSLSSFCVYENSVLRNID